MAGGVSARLMGLPAVRQHLAAVRGKARKRVRKALEAEMREVLRDARSLCPKDTGALKNALGAEVREYRDGSLVGSVGVRKGFQRGRKDPAKYVAYVEHGRRAVVPVKKEVLSDRSRVYGTRAKAVRATHFLERAWQRAKPGLAGGLGRRLGDELARP